MPAVTGAAAPIRLIDGLVDALVTQPPPRLARKLQPQVTADLLRAPPLREQLGDQLPHLAVGLDPPPVTAAPARGCPAMGLERPVTAAARGVAAQLTRNRRRRPASSPAFGRRGCWLLIRLPPAR